MNINCMNCGAMLMNEATICPVCRQPVPPAPRDAGWPQSNMPPSTPSWQPPAGQPTFGPPPLAGNNSKSINAPLLVGIVMVLLLMLGGLFGALIYFKSQRRSSTSNNYNYNRYPRTTPTPYDYETEPPPPPRNGNTGSTRAPISGGVLNGKAITLPPPAYPAIAKSAKASGTVIVQITIDETGKVISARAVSGHPLLQAAAVQAAYKATFSPTKLSGVPVKVTGTISYKFETDTQ